MKDILQDIVSHTHALGNIELLKLTTDNKTTEIDSLADDRSVILKATTHSRVDEFEGVFGMTNLSKLQLHLKNPEYRDKAKINVVKETKDGVEYPSYIHFENEKGDFQNDYRFMNQSIIDSKLKSVKFKGVAWALDFVPTAAAIARLKLMTSVHSDEVHVTVSTDNDGFRFSFGDAGSHAGSYVFDHDPNHSLKRSWAYPVAQIQSILNLDGDINMKVSDEGAMQISVDSGMALYNFILPAQAK